MTDYLTFTLTVPRDKYDRAAVLAGGEGVPTLDWMIAALDRALAVVPPSRSRFMEYKTGIEVTKGRRGDMDLPNVLEASPNDR